MFVPPPPYLDIEKFNNDGKIAVIHSLNGIYGWTSNDTKLYEQKLFDPIIVDYIEKRDLLSTLKEKKDFSHNVIFKYISKIWDVEGSDIRCDPMYLGITWVSKGEKFIVSENDEIVLLRDLKIYQS